MSTNGWNKYVISKEDEMDIIKDGVLSWYFFNDNTSNPIKIVEQMVVDVKYRERFFTIEEFEMDVLTLPLYKGLLEKIRTDKKYSKALALYGWAINNILDLGVN